MSQTGKEPEKKPAQYVLNTTVAVIAGQAGCLTLVIIFLALLAGLWIDQIFDTRPLFTILFMVGSAPVTFIAILWVVRRAAPRINSKSYNKTNSSQEEVDRGRNA
jgi:F0F1-type ATP synthase assembly protein I